MNEEDLSNVDVGSFPIAPHVATKLFKAGFKMIEDFVDIKPAELAKGILTDLILITHL